MSAYERLAVDGEGDVWAWESGHWEGLTARSEADTDEELEDLCPPVTFYEPTVKP